MIGQLINCALVTLKNAFSLYSVPNWLSSTWRIALDFFKYFFSFFSITSSFFPPCWSEVTRGLEFMKKVDVIELSELTTGKSEFKLWRGLPFIIRPWSFIVGRTYIVRMLPGDVVQIAEYISLAITRLESDVKINAFPKARRSNEGARSGKRLSQNANFKVKIKR